MAGQRFKSTVPFGSTDEQVDVGALSSLGSGDRAGDGEPGEAQRRRGVR